jgi:proteasome accessory factor C
MHLPDRLYRLWQLLELNPDGFTIEELQDLLKCSPATFYRSLKELRQDWGFEVPYENERYTLSEHDRGRPTPTVLLGRDEIAGLHLLRSTLAGPAEDTVGVTLDSALLRRLESSLEAPINQPLVRVLTQRARAADPVIFDTILRALWHGFRLKMVTRKNKGAVEREVSPQRLVRYRDTWYLDAFCHLRGSIRVFALDRIESAVNLEGNERQIVPAEELEAELASSYGIFAGKAKDTAILRFHGACVEWVRREAWHPAQTSKDLPDGSYELRFPLGKMEELVGDILSVGAGVEVMGPKRLRKAVREALVQTLEQYND